MDPDRFPRPVSCRQGRLPHSLRPSDVNESFKLANSPLHGLVELGHLSAAAHWCGSAIGRNLLECEYKLSDVFGQDIEVPHRRTIQTRPVQPRVNEPRKRIAMTGTTLAQRNRHQGG